MPCRDTTLRLWDLTDLAPALWARALLTGQIPLAEAQEVHAAARAQQGSQDPGARPGPGGLQLCGPAGAALQDRLGPPGQQVDWLDRGACLSAFFAQPGPAGVMWGLAAAVAAHLGGQRVREVPEAGAGGFRMQHVAVARTALQSQAHRLELGAGSRAAAGAWWAGVGGVAGGWLSLAGGGGGGGGVFGGADARRGLTR